MAETELPLKQDPDQNLKQCFDSSTYDFP
jgi:hypothetical protein